MSGNRPRRLLLTLPAAFGSSLASGIAVAGSALWANRFRSVMTTVGIVIGVMTVTGILSIINGLDEAVERQMDLLGVRSLYVSRWPWARHGRWFLYARRPLLTDRQYRRLKDLVPFAPAMAPIDETTANLSYGGREIADVQLLGTNEHYDRIVGAALARGRFFSASDRDLARPVVVLGSEVAGKLLSGHDPLGKRVRIQGEKYTVVGVLKEQGSFLGQSRDVTALVPLERFRRLFGRTRRMQIALKVAPGMAMEEAQSELVGIMRRVRRLHPREKDDFSVNHQSMLGDLYRDMTGTLYLVIVVVAAISLLVGGIGIMNIMLVSVTERTREIGIRKALGARRRSIMLQFLIESLTLASLGGLLGLALGALTAHSVDSISPLPARLSAAAVAGGLIFSSAVGLFFGLLPAHRASRLDPVEALRHE